MDFRSLSRRELQALCKRNKIPANITNVAMADALAALPLVEGLEEFLNGGECEVPESPMKEGIVRSEVPRTALRTSTRRKAVKDEPKSSQTMTRTRRTAASRCTEEPENKDLNVAQTPSLPGGRRRATANSACKKVDFQMTDDVEKEDNNLDQEENVIEKTPAVPKSQKRVAAASTRRRTETRNNGAMEQRVYSTRRSIRLLEKNMESLSLMEDGKNEPITIHMSFDEMPDSAGPEKDTNPEIGSEKTDDSESKLNGDMEHGINNQEKNETESEAKSQEAEPEMDHDSSTCSAENLITAKSCNDSETDAPDDNLDVKCFSEDEGTDEASKVDAVEISSEEINNADNKLSLPTDDVDLTEVHNSSIVEKFDTEVEGKQNESTCESEYIMGEDSEEDELMNNSAELSPPHENVEEETQVDVLSGVEESVVEVEDGQKEYVYEPEPTIVDNLGENVEALDADIEGNKKETEKVSVQGEDDTMKSSVEIAENVSEDLVDVKIQWMMEKSPKDENEALDSQPKRPNDSKYEEEALVDVSVTSTEEFPTSSIINEVPLAPFAADQLASQFPRPTVTKSPFKEQTIKLLLVDNSDAEDDKEKEEEGCIPRQIAEKTDLSLRQLKKMFKEQLKLSQKKIDNTKIVGNGKVRTALQPLPENRMMGMDEKP